MKANRQIAVNGHRTAFPRSDVAERLDDPGLLALDRWLSPGARDAVLVAVVLLLAASFRLFRIASQPPGLFQDEAVNGVNVYTILNGSPRFYFGEREPLFMYLSTLVSLFLGTTPLALRVTAAFVGIFNAAAVGALGRQLFGKTIGFLAAAGVATSLWLTILSRVGFRATMVPGVECLGLALLWRATRTRKLADYALGGGVTALSLYTYLAARFIPIALVAFVIACAVLHRKWFHIHLTGFAVAAGTSLLVCLPLGYYGLRHSAIIYGRPDQVALPDGAAYVPALTNSIVGTLGMVLVRGDSTWRHNVGGMPVFDPVSGAAFLVGLVVALRRRSPADVLSVVFVLVMLGPGMLSIDSPHFLRTIGAAGGLYLLWAVGVATIARAAARAAREFASRRSVEHTATDTVVIRPPPPRFPRATDLGALAGVVVLALGVTIAAARTAWLYFVVYPRQPEVGAAFNVDLAAAGRFLAAEPLWHTGRANVYVTDHYEIDRTSVTYFLYPYLSPEEKASWLDPSNVGTFFPEDTLIPLPVAPSLYLLPGDDQTTLAALGKSVTRTEWVRPGPDHAVFAVWAQPTNTTPSAPPVAQLGSLLALESASAQPASSNANGETTTSLSLRWRVLGTPRYQPSIFVHLDDIRGHGIAQADLETTLALEQWRPGQELVSNHVVKLPPGTPPGTFTFSVGVYDKITGNRESATVAGEPVATVVAGTLSLFKPVAGAVSTSQRLDSGVAPGLILIGVDGPPSEVEAGAIVPVTLVWRAVEGSRPDVDSVLTLTDGSGAVVGQLREPIGGADFPTSRWASGTTIRQIIDVPISATAKGTATLLLTVQRPGAADAGAAATGPTELARVTVNASTHQYVTPSPRIPLDRNFTDAGRLVGYDLGGSANPGGQLQLTLYWQASGQSGTPYTVFVHLLDAQNQVIAQRDEPPAHGARPTTGWVAREYVADEHLISLDPKLPPGTFRLEVGLYDARSGRRVTVSTGGDSAIIGSVTVGEGEGPSG